MERLLPHVMPMNSISTSCGAWRTCVTSAAIAGAAAGQRETVEWLIGLYSGTFLWDLNLLSACVQHFDADWVQEHLIDGGSFNMRQLGSEVVLYGAALDVDKLAWAMRASDSSSYVGPGSIATLGRVPVAAGRALRAGNMAAIRFFRQRGLRPTQYVLTAAGQSGSRQVTDLVLQWVGAESIDSTAEAEQRGRAIYCMCQGALQAGHVALARELLGEALAVRLAQLESDPLYPHEPPGLLDDDDENDGDGGGDGENNENQEAAEEQRPYLSRLEWAVWELVSHAALGDSPEVLDLLWSYGGAVPRLGFDTEKPLMAAVVHRCPRAARWLASRMRGAPYTYEIFATAMECAGSRADIDMMEIVLDAAAPESAERLALIAWNALLRQYKDIASLKGPRALGWLSAKLSSSSPKYLDEYDVRALLKNGQWSIVAWACEQNWLSLLYSWHPTADILEAAAMSGCRASIDWALGNIAPSYFTRSAYLHADALKYAMSHAMMQGDGATARLLIELHEKYSISTYSIGGREA